MRQTQNFFYGQIYFSVESRACYHTFLAEFCRSSRLSSLVNASKYKAMPDSNFNHISSTDDSIINRHYPSIDAPSPSTASPNKLEDVFNSHVLAVITHMWANINNEMTETQTNLYKQAEETNSEHVRDRAGEKSL